MEEKKKKLLQLISDLSLVVTEDEAREHLSNLNEKQIDDLIAVYEEVKANELKISEIAKNADPAAVEAASEEYLKNVENAEAEYLNRMEAAQKSADELLDKSDNSAGTAASQISSEAEHDLKEIEGEQKEFLNALSSKLS